MNLTPLRYPGGKSIMTPFFIDLLNVNPMDEVVYAEPYAGGAGTAINLLLSGVADRILINDANIAIYSFWHYLLQRREEFIERILKINVTIDEWMRQREILKNSNTPSFDLGIATFFLSRTNRSGILTAGPIGGSTAEKQNNAKYKLDCRFNKQDLCNRMTNIIAVADRIDVYNQDAIAFLQEIDLNDVIVYLDPPYYVNGRSLYMSYYKHNDHVGLSEYLRDVNNFKWVLSYDNVPEIRNMYSGFNLYEFDLKYTAQGVKEGSELLTHSHNIILPPNISIRRSTGDIQLKRL